MLSVFTIDDSAGNDIVLTGSPNTCTSNTHDRLEPSVVSALTLAVPFFKPVIIPSSVTVAISGVRLVHLSFLLSASAGVKLASNCVGIVFTTDAVCNEKSLTINGVTSTSQVALMPEPSCASVFIVALPTLCATTIASSGYTAFIFCTTVATLSSLLVHTILLLSTSSELRVSVIVLSSVLIIETDGSAKVIVSTFNGSMLTSTKALRFVPSVVAAVMRVVPTFLPVTTPSLSTVAISVRLLVHVNFWLSDSNGSTTTLILPVLVLTTETGVVGRDIELTGRPVTSTLKVLEMFEPSNASAFI